MQWALGYYFVQLLFITSNIIHYKIYYAELLQKYRQFQLMKNQQAASWKHQLCGRYINL